MTIKKEVSSDVGESMWTNDPASGAVGQQKKEAGKNNRGRTRDGTQTKERGEHLKRDVPNEEWRQTSQRSTVKADKLCSKDRAQSLKRHTWKKKSANTTKDKLVYLNELFNIIEVNGRRVVKTMGLMYEQ